MLGGPNEVMSILLRNRGLDSDAKRKDGFADLDSFVSEMFEKVKTRRSNLAVRPVCHGLQRQLCPVYSCRLPPYWQPEEQNDQPEGEHYTASHPQARIWLGRWLLPGRC